MVAMTVARTWDRTSRLNSWTAVEPLFDDSRGEEDVIVGVAPILIRNREQSKSDRRIWNAREKPHKCPWTAESQAADPAAGARLAVRGAHAVVVIGSSILHSW